MKNNESNNPSTIIRKLEVFLHKDIVGELLQDISGRTYFSYLNSYLTHSNAIPISHSLPLRLERFRIIRWHKGMSVFRFFSV